MFKLARQREVLWPVTVSAAMDGGPEKIEIKVRYRILSRAEMVTLSERLRQAATGEDAGEVVKALDGELASRITGWEGLADEAGDPLPFNPDNLAAVLNWADLREAIEAGLYAASRGALAKN